MHKTNIVLTTDVFFNIFTGANNNTLFFCTSNYCKGTYQQQDLVPLTLSHLAEFWLYKTMSFGDLLEQVGSTGRFQILHVTLLCIPVLMMASHNLLQNFVASVPHHYCSAHTNLSQSQLSPEETLRITVPLDPAGKPQRCQRYVTPQWHLLAKNGTSGSGEEGDAQDGVDVDLQGCTDGWSYNLTERSSTIISDVGLRMFSVNFFYIHMLPCHCVKLCSIFVSGIWCVICAR